MQLRSPQARQRHVEVTIAYKKGRGGDVMVQQDFFARIATKNLGSLGMDRMVINQQLAGSTSVVKLLKGIDLATERWMDMVRKDLRRKPPGPKCLLEYYGLLADRVACTEPGQKLVNLCNPWPPSTRGRSGRAAHFV